MAPSPLSLQRVAQEQLHSFEKRACYYDAYGRRYCDGYNLSNGARIGIGIAVAVVVGIFIAILLGCMRRRRSASTRPMFTTTPVAQQQYHYQQQPYYAEPQGNNTGYPYGNPYANGAPTPGAGTYAPPSGPPPGDDGQKQYAPPPTAPPPAYTHDGGVKV